MKRLYKILAATQRGMTLIEVVVTLGILSAFFIGTLGIYSTTYTNLRTRESLLNVVEDSDLLMSYIGNDIQNAYEVLKDYQSAEDRTVVAVMKIRKGTPDQIRERVVVYALDANRPNRLFRTVHTEEQTSSTELSTHIDMIKVIPKSEKLFEVQLILEDRVARKISRLQASSTYAMRY